MDFHMRVNDNKAGLEGLDKDRINAIIKEASEGSLYTKYQEKRAGRIEQRIRLQAEVVAKLTTDQIRLSEIEMDRLAKQLEDDRDLSRTIVHIDMDAFYAAVEMRDDPSLRNVPMAVGSVGMLSTSNYLARRFGVRAAMAGYIGKKLCPQLVIVPTNFQKYKQVSEQVRRIFAEYDPNFMAMGWDEAYLDLTDYIKARKSEFGNSGILTKMHMRRRYSGKCVCKLPLCEIPEEDTTISARETCERCGQERLIIEDEVSFGHSAEEVTKELRFRIEQETGLTASAGIAVNKLLSKVCTDIRKPNGQYFLPPCYENIMEFVRELPIRKISGIGGVTEAMLKALGIENCKDLYEKRGVLALLYSSTNARFFLRVSLGLGSTVIDSTSEGDCERKSIGVERTFSPVSEPEALDTICLKLCQKAVENAKKKGLKARTVVLKMKTVEFETRTRATTLDGYVCDFEPVYKAVKRSLLEELASSKQTLCLRLLGVRLASFLHETEAFRLKLPQITRYMRPGDTTAVAGASTSASRPEEQQSFDGTGLANGMLDDDDEVVILDVESTSITSTHERANDPGADVQDWNDDQEEEQDVEYISPVCPVCNCRVTRSTLDGFNAHVDQCLNRSTISELVKRQNQELSIPVAKRSIHSSGTRNGKAQERMGPGKAKPRNGPAKAGPINGPGKARKPRNGPEKARKRGSSSSHLMNKNGRQESPSKQQSNSRTIDYYFGRV